MAGKPAPLQILLEGVAIIRLASFHSCVRDSRPGADYRGLSWVVHQSRATIAL